MRTSRPTDDTSGDSTSSFVLYSGGRKLVIQPGMLRLPIKLERAMMREDVGWTELEIRFGRLTADGYKVIVKRQKPVFEDERWIVKDDEEAECQIAGQGGEAGSVPGPFDRWRRLC